MMQFSRLADKTDWQIEQEGVQISTVSNAEVDYYIKFKQEAEDDVVLKAFPNFHVDTWPLILGAN